MERVTCGRAAVAFCEESAVGPDAFVEGGVPALGEDEAFVGAHFGCCVGCGYLGYSKWAFFSLGAKPFLLRVVGYGMEWNGRAWL